MGIVRALPPRPPPSKRSQFWSTQIAAILDSGRNGNGNMVMVTFAKASVLALVLDRNPLLCNQTVCGIGILSALVTNGLPPL